MSKARLSSLARPVVDSGSSLTDLVRCILDTRLSGWPALGRFPATRFLRLCWSLARDREEFTLDPELQQLVGHQHGWRGSRPVPPETDRSTPGFMEPPQAAKGRESWHTEEVAGRVARPSDPSRA